MVGAVPLAAAPTAAGRMNGVTPVPGETAATSFVQPPAANVVTSNSQAEPAVMATSVRAEVITVAAPLAAGSGQSTKVTAQPSVPNGLSVPNGHAAAVPAVAAAVLRTESEPASTVENVWTRLEAMAAEGTKLKARYEKLEVRLASKELELQRLQVLPRPRLAVPRRQTASCAPLFTPLAVSASFPHPSTGLGQHHRQLRLTSLFRH